MAANIESLYVGVGGGLVRSVQRAERAANDSAHDLGRLCPRPREPNVRRAVPFDGQGLLETDEHVSQGGPQDDAQTFLMQVTPFERQSTGGAYGQDPRA